MNTTKYNIDCISGLFYPSCDVHHSLILKYDFLLGQVIKAWDVGVATMKKGEICHLLCKPEYAYGSAGSTPKIPSNATLFFEASMWEDVGVGLEGWRGGCPTPHPAL